MSDLEKFTGNSSLIEGSFSYSINRMNGICTVYNSEDGVELIPYLSFAPFTNELDIDDVKNIGYLITDYLSSKRKVN